MPLDGLTQYFASADGPHTFRVDLPDGEYEVILLAPAVAHSTTPIRVHDTTVAVGGTTPGVAQLNAVIKGGSLDVVVGGQETWALSGLIVRPLEPIIAHLSPVAVRADEDLVITATATAPDEIRSVRLRYRAGSRWHEIEMDGDGVDFHALVPATDLVAESLEYEFVAGDVKGRTSRLANLRTPIVRDFRPPRIPEVDGPSSWRSMEKLVFGLVLEDGEYAREVRLHYREADQNREFRLVKLPGGRSGVYEFTIDLQVLDAAYELIYYFELVDVLGGGSFYPDPFKEARYFICKLA